MENKPKSAATKKPKPIYNKSCISAICSGTTGIGKTWFAAALCHALSLMRKNVLYFDADCGLENISYQNSLEKSTPYASLINGQCTLNNAVFRFERGKFDVISSPSGEDALISAPIGRAQILAGDLLRLAQYYDYVFIDCADNGSKQLNPFFNICKNIIILVNACSSSSIAAFKKIEELQSIAPQARFNIVINRALSYEEGRQTYKTLLKASKEYIKVDLNLLGIIRQDARIRDTVINHALLLNRYQKCEGAEDSVAAARRFLEEQI